MKSPEGLSTICLTNYYFFSFAVKYAKGEVVTGTTAVATATVGTVPPSNTLSRSQRNLSEKKKIRKSILVSVGAFHTNSGTESHKYQPRHSFAGCLEGRQERG